MAADIGEYRRTGAPILRRLPAHRSVERGERFEPSLVGLFRVGCVPVALSEIVFPERRWPLLAAVLVLWAAL